MKNSHEKLIKNISKTLGIWNAVSREQNFIKILHKRLQFLSYVVIFMFFAVMIKLFFVMIVQEISNTTLENDLKFSVSRSNIIDAKNELIATNIVTSSVYANPKKIIDTIDAAKKLITLFPKIEYKTMLKKISSNKSFVWISRHISPAIQQKIYYLGIPGIYLKKDQKRIYPLGNIFSHIVGYCNLDGDGIAGIEQYFDKEIKTNTDPLKLSLDSQIQYVVRYELLKSIEEFNANAGNAIVMSVKTGKILAIVSLPDFNPNFLSEKLKKEHFFNRNTLGIYEPGSTFKILNSAIALESRTATIDSLFDARTPIKIGRFKVTDFRGKNRILTLKEAFVYSSNIAAIKIAEQFGKDIQRLFFNKFKVLSKAKIEIPEIGKPQYPINWTNVTTMTAAYGYGISTTPINLIASINGIINNGIFVNPTLLESHISQKEIILSERTSKLIRYLMRTTALEGGSRKTNIEGFNVFAKTGTAYIAKGGKYLEKKSRLTSCIAGFPENDPEYIILLMLEDPKPSSKTYGFAAAGWNAAPTVGKIIERIGPILGIDTKIENESNVIYIKHINTKGN